MEPTKHIVIFSHGFGVRKDARGMFPEIVSALGDIQPVLFDYNEINETDGTLTVRPLKKQAGILREQIETTKAANPEAVIDLICHSQGSLVAALAKPTGIRKTILLAPPFGMNSRMLATFANRPGSKIDMEGTSRLVRRDGSITLVPAEFWKERESIRPIEIYNALAQETELVIIQANQDEVLEETDLSNLDPKIRIIKLDADHNFTDQARKPLLDTLKKISAPEHMLAIPPQYHSLRYVRPIEWEAVFDAWRTGEASQEAWKKH